VSRAEGQAASRTEVRQTTTQAVARRMVIRGAAHHRLATRTEAHQMVTRATVAVAPHLEVRAPTLGILGVLPTLVTLTILVTLAIRTILVVLVISPKAPIREARIQKVAVAPEVHLPMAIPTLEAQVQTTTMVPELRQEDRRTAARKMATLVEVQGVVALLATAALLATLALEGPRMMARKTATLAEALVSVALLATLALEHPRTMARKMATPVEVQEAVALLTTVVLGLMLARNLMLEVNQVAMSSFLCLSSLPLVLPRQP
jgi:hypothetical protein